MGDRDSRSGGVTSPDLAAQIQAEIDGISPRRQALDRWIQDMVNLVAAWILGHWLLLANAGIALLLALAVGVAYLRSVGALWLAEPISRAFLLLCPQRPDHSYFPFGAQMALEEREVAMFGALILGGILVALAGGRLRPLPFRLVVLLSIPLAWDGFSQMFGFRDSDWLTRTWTGGLASLAFALWVYPLLDRALRPDQQALARVRRATVANGEKSTASC